MKDRGDEDDPWIVVETIAVGLALVLTLAVVPFVAALLHSGVLIDLGVVESVAGVVRVMVEGRWNDPGSAFPRDVAESMPAALGWWSAAAWTTAIIVAVGVGAWKRVDALVSTATLDRRPYQVRGSRPRTWARPRDLVGVVDRRSRPGRFTLGRLDGRLLLSDAQAHVALIAPTRSGKTTRYVIPWLLEHQGPAIVTSTKLDVVEATRQKRAALGTVWVWDPFGAGDTRWNPLDGCTSWSRALAQAQWLADATGEGDSEIAAYWRGEAAKLLAPLMHAAAIASKPMRQVLLWVDGQELEEPAEVLRDEEAEDALLQLVSVTALDPRNRGTTYMSAGSLLSAYRYPEVDSDKLRPFMISEFLARPADTLFVVAGARHQRLLAPCVVGLLSAVLHEAAERSRRGEASPVTLRVLLDEAANIAPMRDLPAHLSQAAGHGVRMATVWQSLAQLQDRYRTAADSVLANSTSKVFMGPITDERTRRYVQGLLGHSDQSSDGQGAAAASALRQIARGHALVVEGRQMPAIVATHAPRL